MNFASWRTDRPRRWFVALGLILLAAMASAAWAMSVSPVVIDLEPAGRRSSQIVTVENRYSRPVVLEMRVQEAEYTDEGVHGTGVASDDLLAFPPQVIIPPNGTQAVRVQYVGEPDVARGKHYFMTVAQLPVELPEGQTAVQLLYNFQVVVGVNPSRVRPQIAVQSANIYTETGDGSARLQLVLTNDSAAYGYLSGGSLRVIQRNAAGTEVYNHLFSPEEIAQVIGYGLVGAGQTRRLLTPIILPEAGGSVEARFTPTSR